MKYLRILLISFILLNPSAFAEGGSSVGHGGTVFQCGSTIQIVDAWEGEDSGFPLSLGNNPSAPLRDLAKIYLDRLSFFEPSRAIEYQAISNRFFADLDLLAIDPKSPDTVLVRFTKGILPFSLDSDEITQPNGCIKRQAVTQRLPLIDGERLFTISFDLWSRMTNEMRVLTIFHEINVKYLSTNLPNFISTAPARLLNRFIGSEKISNSKTICGYRKSLADFGMDYDEYSYGELKFPTYQADPEITCWSTTRLLRTAYYHGQKIFTVLGNTKIELRSNLVSERTFSETAREWQSFKNGVDFNEQLVGGNSSVTISGGTVERLGDHTFILTGANRIVSYDQIIGHADFEFKDDGVTPVKETLLP